MRSQWKSVVIVAALALFLGLAAPTWSQVIPPPTLPLADPMAEDYAVHLIPFYKIDANWSAFLIVADTSYQDLAPSGTPIFLTFYNTACDLVSDAILNPTQADAQYFPLHDPSAADGQFNGIPSEGVILLDGRASRFLTYVILVNGNNNSMVRLDSIPCMGTPPTIPGAPGLCSRGGLTGTWLRYDTYNTVAATFGDSGAFATNLYFFSAMGDLRSEMLLYGRPRHGDWVGGLHVDGWCDEIYLGSRRLELECTQRRSLTSLNYTRLNVFPNPSCAGMPGHIETFASLNGTDVVDLDYSGFQETIAALVPPTNMIGTGYYHHREREILLPPPPP